MLLYKQGEFIMEKFKALKDTKLYLKYLLKHGEKVEYFVKAIPVTARKAVEGEQIVTTVKDKDANTFTETVNVAQKGDWIVTNVGGESYIVTNQNFHKLYGEDEKEGTRIPISTPRKLIKIQHNVSFEAPWGETMNIKKGGYLNLDNLNGIYGINPEEFKQTHVAYEPSKEEKVVLEQLQKEILAYTKSNEKEMEL